MMKTIIIPTDFSRNAWKAIEYALEFFKEETCTFYFLHAYSPAFYRMDYMMGGPEFSAIPDIGIDISQAGLEKTIEQVKAKHFNPRHRFEMVSSFNTLTDEVNDMALKKNADMIVMGTKGATGAHQIFLGSNTVFVLRKARIPVLVIPEKAPFTPVRTIALPSDYRSTYNIELLQPVLDLVTKNKSELIVLYVDEGEELDELQEKNKKSLKNLLDSIPHRFIEMKGQKMPEAVLNFIEAEGIDLLAMINRKHSFFERLLIRQNIDQIGFHVEIPFLMVPDLP